jgi:hypothetical protein
MSLWSKTLANISYADVADFCANGMPEGANLDYKADIPTKLEKVAASLANTSGGLVVFGVTTNDANRPKDIVGIPNVRGFSEQVTQICRDRITPPITPEVSALLPLPTDAGRAVAVMRIHQSSEAPHAIQNSTRVYIRRSDVTDIIDLADIGRIEYLLNLRNRVEAKAKSLRDRHMARFEHIAAGKEFPSVWWIVAPLYPGLTICSLDAMSNARLRDKPVRSRRRMGAQRRKTKRRPETHRRLFRHNGVRRYVLCSSANAGT